MQHSIRKGLLAAALAIGLVMAIAIDRSADTRQRDGALATERDIQDMIDLETAAWDEQDVQALVSLFHPDMVWPWPPDPQSHDPATWVFPQGRFDRERWTGIYRDFFSSHELVHNIRQTIKITVSAEGDGAFAVVDVDTLWKNVSDGQLVHWKGRAGKGYTLVDGRWLLIFHTGLLDYQEG